MNKVDEVQTMTPIQDHWVELGDRLRRFIGSRIRDPATAGDLTQDVLVKVQERLGDLLPDEKLPAWVFAVARNAVIDHYRSRAVRDHADVADVQPVAAEDDEKDQRDAAHGLASCLSRMVELLPEPYREAMKLADLQGLSQQEVADRTGVSLSGAKSRVQRARQMLREMIEDCCKVERDGRGNIFDFETTARSFRYCGSDDDGKPRCGS